MKLAKEPIDDWFSMLGDSPIANMLRLYAQVSSHVFSINNHIVFPLISFQNLNLLYFLYLF